MLDALQRELEGVQRAIPTEPTAEPPTCGRGARMRVGDGRPAAAR